MQHPFSFSPPLLERFFKWTNDKTDHTDVNTTAPVSSSQALSNGVESVFGVRHHRRDKVPLRHVAITLVKVVIPGLLPEDSGRSYAHTVWVSGGQLFAIAGFHTAAFNVTELSIRANTWRNAAVLTTPDGSDIVIKPHGPSWQRFLEKLAKTHPQIEISDRVWKLPSHRRDLYEYFERL